MYTKHSVEIDGSPMEMLMFVPEGDGPFPSMVVAQHLPVAHTGLERDQDAVESEWNWVRRPAFGARHEPRGRRRGSGFGHRSARAT